SDTGADQAWIRSDRASAPSDTTKVAISQSRRDREREESIGCRASRLKEGMLALVGTKAADLPNEQPRRSDPSSTSGRPRGCGLTIVQPLLLRTDQVIE